MSVNKLLGMFADGTLSANAMVMMRHNKVVCEFYRAPFTSDRYHLMASVTKSIVAIAAGFAVDEGLISVTDKVTGYFPDIVKTQVDANLSLMTIENLLTMTSGHKADWDFEGLGTGDVIKEFLLTPVPNKPGVEFSYNTDGVNVLSQIVERASGVRFDKYVHERLFGPLGIENYMWEIERNGIINAGFGLYLTARDLAKIGTFLLNNGMWAGKQLLSPEWVKRAGSRLCDNGEYGYGYLFWRQKPEDSYAAIGGGNQYCVVLPKEDMVVVLLDAYGVLDAVWDAVLPWHDAEPPAEISVSFEMPKGDMHSESANTISGKKYSLQQNPLKITHISFDFNKYEVTLFENEKSCVCKIGFSQWTESETYADPYTALTQHYGEVHTPVFIAGAWQGEMFHMRMIFACTLMVEDMFITFSNDGSTISIDYKSNNKAFVDPDMVIDGVMCC